MIDIKDAYYTVSIATEHQKFLKFRWRDNLYQYTCLPNGLASAPRIFTKLLKPVFNILRQKGYLSSSYIDDCYLQGATYGECHDNVQETVMLFGDLGFPIHNEKSVLIPSQVLTFLEFVHDCATYWQPKAKTEKCLPQPCWKRNLHSSTCGRSNWADSAKFSRGGTWAPPLSQSWKGQIKCFVREQRQLWIFYDPICQF